MRASISFSRVLRRYGRAVTLCDRDGKPLGEGKGFLQAIPENDAKQFSPTPLGLARQERFLYLGEAGLALRAQDDQLLCCDGLRYRIERAQPVFLGKELCHWRALLRRQDEVSE